jgi:uncharacterized protein YbjT (DUF2867 family)
MSSQAASTSEREARVPARLVVTGGTGLAGSAVVRAALRDAEVSRVVSLARRPLGAEHLLDVPPELARDKLFELRLDDFTRYEPAQRELADCTAVVWCLGVPQSSVSPAEYERITYDYVLACARALTRSGSPARFCFLSGSGADSREKSPIRFARLKGKAENALFATLPDVSCARPGYIRPGPGSVLRRPLGERLFGVAAPLLARLSDDLVIDDAALGRALVALAKRGAAQRVLDNRALLALGAEPAA